MHWRIQSAQDLSAASAPPASSERQPLTAALICAGLMSATLAVYWQTIAFGLVDIDDHGYVGSNSGPVSQGLTWEGVRWAFTTGHLANWHPLTWLSLMLDRSIRAKRGNIAPRISDECPPPPRHRLATR